MPPGKYSTEWQQQSAVPIVLLKEEGCNVARGRNLAIKAAKYDLIVSTDFGCRFENSWLEKLLSHFSTDERLEVVGGAYGVNLERLTTQHEMNTSSKTVIASH